MANNVTEKYELTNGTAIIDNNLSIITANETLYRFIGITNFYTFMDVIHEVDLDDFVDVTHSLGNEEKSIVVRMKRFDNSYRWMIIKLKRVVNKITNSLLKDFIQLSVSDILALERQVEKYRNSIVTDNHVMALEGSIYFSYNCKDKIISFYSYVDRIKVPMSECPLLSLITDLRTNSLIDPQVPSKMQDLYDDFLNCKSEFLYQFSSKYFSVNNDYENLLLKASVIYEKLQPSIIVGTIRNMSNTDMGYSRNTYLHSNYNELLSSDQVNDFVNENIALNIKSELTLILMEIDHYDNIQKLEGEEYAIQLYNSVIRSTKELIGYRGVVGSYKPGAVYIAIKNNISDINTRAFVESLRSQISWDYRLINEDDMVTFSIGISRRPYNGTNGLVLYKKAIKALEIAKQKGHDRYILYIDNVFGDVL